MPVRSMHSYVLKWPDRAKVFGAIEKWIAGMVASRPEIVRIAVIGSYARNDWGPGSDVDLVLVVREATLPFAERGRLYDASTLPVPADLLVYTQAEFDQLTREDNERRMGAVLAREAVWLYERAD